MFVFVLAPLAAVAATWGVSTAASVMVGAEVMSGRMAKREAKKSYKLDMNPEKQEKEFICFELESADLPPELQEYARKYIMTEGEQLNFLSALDCKLEGRETYFNFDWMKRVQGERFAEPALKHMQN